MFDSLENEDRIDGIVMEMFSGIASLKMTTALNQQFVIAKVIWNKRPFGVAYRDDWFFNTKDFSDCFSNVIKLKRTDVLQTVNRYTQLPEVWKGSDGFLYIGQTRTIFPIKKARIFM